MSDWKLEIANRQTEIVQWAFIHDRFREELLADPRGVIEKELQIQVPPEARIEILEDKESLVHIVLSLSVPQEGADAYRRLVTRALGDPSFRKELRENPKSVIESEFGTELPRNLEIVVREETPDTCFITLPWNREAAMATQDGAIDQEFLASIAGAAPLVEQIAADGDDPFPEVPAPSTSTRAYSSCCCGILTISSCIGAA
jgi:hypothetical protein